MHFHLPKPLHGWREFLGEVGIIVVGVLIALGAEQVVEDWRWERKARGAHDAIMEELALNAGVFDERALGARCLEDNLNQIARILKAARRSGKLPNIERIQAPATRPVVTAAWNAATADGTVSHLSPEFRKMLSLEYPLIAEYPGKVNDEQQLWTIVRLAEQSPGSVSETLLADMSTALARVRYETRINDVVAEQSLDQLLKAGVRPNYSFPMDDGASRAELIAFLKDHGCQPLVVDGKPRRAH